MQKLASGKSASNVSRSQRAPLRPRADEVLKAIARAYGLPITKVLDRSHPKAFKAAVYLLRRQANLSLRQVAKMAAISAPRVSQIQTEIETEGADKVLTILSATIKKD